MEFNPQLAGQDITPANLEFGSTSTRRRERREKSLSGASAQHGKNSNQFQICLPHRFSFIGNQPPFYSHQPSSCSAAAHDEIVPLVRYDKKNPRDTKLISRYFRTVIPNPLIHINQV